MQHRRTKPLRYSDKPNGSSREKKDSSLFLESQTLRGLGNITLDETISSALTNANARISISISPNGTEVEILAKESSKPIGNLSDLLRISGLHKFVKDQRQKAEVVNITPEVAAVIRNLSEMIRADDFAWRKPANTIELVKLIEAVNKKMAIVDENLALLEATEPTWDNRTTLGYLLFMCKRVESAYGHFLMDLIRDGKVRRHALSDELAAAGIPVWVHGLLTKKTFDRHEFDVNRLFYPSDPREGITLTVDEWRDRAVTNLLGPILDKSRWLIDLFSNDQFFRDLHTDKIGMIGSNLDLIVERYYKCPFHVVPHVELLSFAMSPLANSHPPKFGGSLPSGLEPKDISKLFSEVLKRFATGTVANECVQKYWATLYTTLDVKVVNKSPRDIAREIIEREEEFSPIYPDVLNLGKDHVKKLYVEVVAQMLGLPPDCKTMSAISESLDRLRDSINSGDVPTNTLDPDIWAEYFQSSPAWKESIGYIDPDGHVIADENTVIDDRSRRPGRVRSGIHLTSLTFSSKRLMRALAKQPDTDSLRPDIEAWLRGFSSEEIQSAVSQIMRDNFNSLFLRGVDRAIEDDPDGDGSDAMSDQTDIST